MGEAKRLAKTMKQQEKRIAARDATMMSIAAKGKGKPPLLQAADEKQREADQEWNKLGNKGIRGYMKTKKKATDPFPHKKDAKKEKKKQTALQKAMEAAKADEMMMFEEEADGHMKNADAKWAKKRKALQAHAKRKSQEKKVRFASEIEEIDLGALKTMYTKQEKIEEKRRDPNFSNLKSRAMRNALMYALADKVTAY